MSVQVARKGTLLKLGNDRQAWWFYTSASWPLCTKSFPTVAIYNLTIIATQNLQELMEYASTRGSTVYRYLPSSSEAFRRYLHCRIEVGR